MVIDIASSGFHLKNDDASSMRYPNLQFLPLLAVLAYFFYLSKFFPSGHQRDQKD